MSQDVPGTIHLWREADGEHPSSSGAIILQPRPSTDPEDPLNWPLFRKQMAIWQVNLYVFAVGIATTVQYSVLTQISNDTGITIGQLNLGTGLMFLFLGWDCLLWQPLAWYLVVGAFILSRAPFPSSLWFGHPTLGALASGTPTDRFSDCLQHLSSRFRKFRYRIYSLLTSVALFMAIYAFILFGSNFSAPFFAGFINDGSRWHAVMYFGAAVLAACVVINFFFLEETLYFRGNAEVDAGVTSDKDIAAGSHTNPEHPKDKTPNVTDAQSTHHHPKPTYLSKLGLFKRIDGSESPSQMWRYSWRALTNLIFYPNIVWAGLLYGTNLAWYNVLNGTISSTLGSSPYDFKPTIVGVAYLSPFVSSSIACFWSGNFAH